MAETTNVSIRMDPELKKQADALFNALGMNLSTAFNIFTFYYNIFGQESRAASPAFPPSRA